MPELPDVEIYKKYFDSTSLNKKIEKTEVKGPEMLSGVKKNDLVKELNDDKFISSHRHGKYFFATLEKGASLVLHFGMTGFLEFYNDKSDAPKYTKLLISFKDGKLAFDDRRKLGLISLTKNIDDYVVKKNLGPDALNGKLKYKDFYELVHHRTAPIKAVLMNQDIIAGIGNVYADEILFQSSIDPHSQANVLPAKKVEEIFTNIKKILTYAIKHEAEWGSFSEDYLLHKRKKKQECPQCGGEILISSIGGRTTYYCNKHQKKFS